VPIIRPGDVRRMLLAQKAWVEGGLALVLYCGWLADHERCAGDDATRAELNRLLELLTPIAKSWPSEFCLEANKLAIQVHGGYGYTRDYPVERLYRDNRLNHIHEGTHGIHGLDLLGRKLPMQGGAALKDLAGRIATTIAKARAAPELADFAQALASALDDAMVTSRRLVGELARDPERALANATIYLDSLGHVVVAWRWLEMACTAAHALPGAGPESREFLQGKLAACRYFFRYELPRTGPMFGLLRSLDDTALTIPDGGF
jgi:butyryl-CoA dehydrogenase